MTGIERAADIQLGRPQVPVQMAVECPPLGRLASHFRPQAGLYRLIELACVRTFGGLQSGEYDHL